MFDEKQLSQLDPVYFNIITLDDRDVTIQSRNTGYYWYLHCTEYPTEDACIIFHKHRFSHPYHQHEGTEKVDNTACICYNVNIKYRRCFYDRTTAEISVKSIHGNI